MERSAIEIVGMLAGTCTTLAFVPQVLKAWRTRCTRDLSLGMYLVLAAGMALWLAYGLLIGSPSVVAANAATLLLVLVVLGLKLRHG